MRAKTAIDQRRSSGSSKTRRAPVLTIPSQAPDAIRRRSEIREALHDLKSRIVRGKQD
jgi:hypothetical protein